MLVLTRRKKDQAIIIDETISVEVVKIRPDTGRLGIVAPRDIPVHRQEVYAAIQAGQPSHAALAGPLGLPAPAPVPERLRSAVQALQTRRGKRSRGTQADSTSACFTYADTRAR